MATVGDQARAEAQRRREQAAREQEIMAQPGPTAEKAALEHDRRVEAIRLQMAEDRKDLGGESWLPNAPIVERGALFGLDVPLSGLAKGLDFWGHPGSTFGERYEAGEAFRRGDVNRAKAEAVVPPLAQEILGGLFASGPSNAAANWAREQIGQRAIPAAVPSWTRGAAEPAIVGGVTGGIHGVSTGEGDISKRLMQGAKEAAFGGVAGSLLGTAGRALQPETATAVRNVATADEFGIPLTRGGATGDIAQQKAEQALIHGGISDTASREMAAHQRLVDAARQGAATDIRDRFASTGPHGFRGDTAEESGQLLAESIRRRAQRQMAAGGGRIEQALTAGVEIDVPSLRTLADRVDTALAGPVPGVPAYHIGPLTPAAADARQQIDNFLQTLPTDPSARISMAGLNQLRRNIIGIRAQPGNVNDDRVLGAIQREVDSWMDDVIGGQGAGALPSPGVTGPDEALQTLREGNAMYRRGAQTERPSGMDVTPAQKNVAKLAREDAVGNDAVRIFTVNNRGGVGAEATRTARQIATQFGENSPQMARVRDIATVSLLDGGPQQVSARINAFLTTNRQAAEAMFTPDQLARLDRFRRATRLLVPDPAATNPSKSSYGVMKTALRSALVGGGAMLGSQLGGEASTAAQLALTAAGAIGGQTAGAVQSGRAIQRALQPIPSGAHLMPAAANVGRVTPAAVPLAESLLRLMAPGDPVPVDIGADIPRPRR